MRETGTIVDEWKAVKAPSPPELKAVTVDSQTTALVVMDIQKQNCTLEKRPRCVSSVPNIQSLLAKAREKGMAVLYTLTRNAEPTDFLSEVAPRPGEPVVKSGVDKFYGTDLEKLLRERNITTVIMVGTAAHGAVLHTSTGAALRGFQVVVPVDGMSADPYAEQYTAWHLVNAPGSKGQTTLTRISMIQI